MNSIAILDQLVRTLPRPLSSRLLLAALSAGALAVAAPAHAAPRAVFYLMETQKSANSFNAHVDKIDLLVPTWYGVDANGLVNGAPNPQILALARSKHLAVMPIVSMTAGRDGFHKLLNNPDAQREMNAALVREALAHGYAGFQYDFESIVWTDRDAFTRMFQATSEALHKAGLQSSVAVVPNAPGHPDKGVFSKWMWEYWRGAYDIEALAKAGDFISLMTYDQHTRWTAPGPVDGWRWVNENLAYALKVVPKNKLSLGIALYGYRWFTGNPVDEATGKERQNISADYIDADESIPLAATYGAKIRWDDEDRTSYYWFDRDGMREWVFMPDARGFRERYELVKQSGIDGFSAWVLGAEDPKVWDALPVARR
jgi:spore germination protein YaaH